MDEMITRQIAIEALKICDTNEDVKICHICPMRDERWDGAWEDNETICYKKLMRDSAKLLALPSAQPTGTNTVQVEDCISREAAVDAIEGVDWYHQNDSGEMVHGANSAEDQPWYKAEDIYAAIEGVPPAQPVEDARAMCGECDAWNKYKNYPQPEQFNPCTVCQEFDCTGCKFRRT